MGIQTIEMREKSLHNLTLGEVEKHFGNSGKPLGSMSLDELLEKVWAAEARNSTGTDPLNMALLWSGKTVDQVWKEIRQNERNRYDGDSGVKVEEREPVLGEVTLEVFLKHAQSLNPTVEIDSSVDPTTPGSLRQQLSLSSSPSVNVFSGTASSGRRRDMEPIEKSIERKLRRKIKNRESAARSRARKQAYHNELVTKISRLEEENMKLKKEKEFDLMFPGVEYSSEPKYQLRRTSSGSF
ncbi:PREDICTED: ABSCISIC ACID-INSENSITIVE 5-like protein 2 [Tarenaya hassleriana]|uniref:ABSCISIC ACID-INSENSITIVE 5-like protein 2 n=1 Tax=Tarenaya hassleriana TaxID=28532 RepID=UPI00053C9754|nr:PREDICTED: ABSCISIC ACID-INSENSITIVE 5-like protein 2 [Tarenaya hassleriana]